MGHRIRRSLRTLLVAVTLLLTAPAAEAHPLGNFTVNQFARVEVRADGTSIRYVVDMAEIPTLQELASIDPDGDGASADELGSYAARTAAVAAAACSLRIDGADVALRVADTRAELRPGNGGLLLLRLDARFEAEAEIGPGSTPGRIRFENAAFADRLGWREIVVATGPGVAGFDATAFATSASDELRGYPEDGLTAPLDERVAEISVLRGAVPAGAAALVDREGRAFVASRDSLAELIALPDLTLWTGLLGLLIAAGLGGMHAMSPGHGKAIVGAYLIGSRGTPRHAMILGLTVTVTHTIGVFALGLLTLFASRYVLPERLFPILGLASGAVVLVMGATLFVTRLRAALGMVEHRHDHDPAAPHSHGGVAHTHLPPGADGSSVTARSLVALGVSGGLLPCPSALVVLLSAIALDRVGYGLVLVLAFSVGLASVLTAVGLAFLYAGRLVAGAGMAGPLLRILPVASALVIAALGAVICHAALGEAGIDLVAELQRAFSAAREPDFAGAGAFGVLGLGLLFGLKHATEADHVVAVSSIVSEHGKLARAALVGALWGVGHTLSLVVVGSVVVVLRIAISETVASWLEFGVAGMIVTLGVMAVWRGLSARQDVHVHAHAHDGVEHAHIHFHEQDAAGLSHAHTVARIGLKPLVVGAVHGLAGSAALTLLVLAQIESTPLGLVYLLVFGLGSIGGMLLMSGIVGLPFALTAGRLTRAHHALQLAAGAFSVLFGVWYAFTSGAVTSLVLSALQQ